VAAPFGDAPVRQDEDLVGVHDGREAMGDDQGRAPDRDPLELGLDRLLGPRVEG
jgi:hypothetical protein